MNKQKLSLCLVAATAVACIMILSACHSNAGRSGQEDTRTPKVEKHGFVGGPQIGKPGGGPSIDKSSDTHLQTMIKELLPKFSQETFIDPVDGDTLRYNLFTPENKEAGKNYPLLLFMADASTPGPETTLPLTQGYGALVWATAQSQAENPCYILVPQYNGVTVNDAYETSPEVERTIRLLNEIVRNQQVDTCRLYTTGQSMGGMMSMYFNVAHPGLFAASIFVDCHWDNSVYGKLADDSFIYIVAGPENRAGKNAQVIESLLDKENKKYGFAEWSARLPQSEQDSLAAALLDKNYRINIIAFSAGSVLPESGEGSEHMYSFDYAYKLAPVRQWLFRQSKEK